MPEEGPGRRGAVRLAAGRALEGQGSQLITEGLAGTRRVELGVRTAAAIRGGGRGSPGALELKVDDSPSMNSISARRRRAAGSAARGTNVEIKAGCAVNLPTLSVGQDMDKPEGLGEMEH